MKNIKRFGWIKDHPDPRDRMYALWRRMQAVPAAAAVSAELLPAVWDQGDLGSCTAHGILCCEWFARLRQASPERRAFSSGGQATQQDMLSRLMLYYLEREMEGSIESDCGAAIRDGIKALNKQGDCHEDLWPYRIEKFAERPTEDCFADALEHQSLEYLKIPDGDLRGMKACLAGEAGWPFTFGFLVYEQFMSKECAKTGIVRIPEHDEMLLGAIGGHCVAAIGYDDNKEMPDGMGAIKCRNSWGADWGDQGNFYMPYGYFDELMVNDIWTIRKVE